MKPHSLIKTVRYTLAGASSIALAFLAVGTSLGFANRSSQSMINWGGAAPLSEAVHAERIMAEGLTAATSPTAVNPAVLKQAEQLATRALYGDPLSARAIRTLALATAISGRYERGEALIVSAGHVSRRDQATEAWLIERAYRLNDMKGAALHFDALLRVSRSSRDAAFKTTVPLMNRPALFEAISKRMALQPEWRTPFLYQLSTTSNPDIALSALHRLVQLGTPPSDEELQPLFARAASLPDVARWQKEWKSFLPKNQASDDLVYDGALNGAPGVQPFNWELTEESNVNTVRLPREDGKGGAIRTELYTTSAAVAARQLLALKPGRYRFNAASMIDEGSPEGLKWTILCNGRSGTELMNAPIPNAAAYKWHQQQGVFQVPAAGCDGQWLLLATDVTGETTERAIWVDDVQITPAN